MTFGGDGASCRTASFDAMSANQASTPPRMDTAAVEQALERALREIFKAERWEDVEPSAARAWQLMVPSNERRWSDVRDDFKRRWPHR